MSKPTITDDHKRRAALRFHEPWHMTKEREAYAEALAGWAG